jgi:hypothetical protein
MGIEHFLLNALTIILIDLGTKIPGPRKQNLVQGRDERHFIYIGIDDFFKIRNDLQNLQTIGLADLPVSCPMSIIQNDFVVRSFVCNSHVIQSWRKVRSVTCTTCQE